MWDHVGCQRPNGYTQRLSRASRTPCRHGPYMKATPRLAACNQVRRCALSAFGSLCGIGRTAEPAEPWGLQIPCVWPPPDDAMSILMAFNSPELRVLGLTTVYGNVPTSLATQNALRLVEMAGKARQGAGGQPGSRGVRTAALACRARPSHAGSTRQWNCLWVVP